MHTVSFSRFFSLSLVTSFSLLTPSLLLSSDVVVSGNVILTTNPSTATEGNILKGDNSFIHNFGVSNTFVGENAGNFTMTGSGGNTGIGVFALTTNTSGSANTAIGNLALNGNTSGIRNTAVGFAALLRNTSNSFSTAVGSRALTASTGAGNTAVGSDSLQATTTGNNNTAIGANALFANTIGQGNTAVGSGAVIVCTSGGNNVGIGNSTFNNLTTGSNNIALGTSAGQSLTSGNGNIYINANAGISSEATTIRIGTLQTRCFIAGIRNATTGNANAVAVLIDSNGQLGTISSSASVKHDIQDMDTVSSHVLQLRPVTFIYNSDATNTRQYGLIAEEVDEIFPSLVVYNQEGKPETLKYHVLPVLLLNEVKKQQLTVEQMNNVINNLQAQVQEFINRVKILETKA